jgi:hypothetical protein
MELNRDIRDRILAAADALYDQAGRASFPTVDSVRKVAKVNMNDAATTMKEWRRAQTAQAAPVAITVPEAVHQLHSQALAALWQSAQNTANESLRAAQAGWEAERAEAETINKQLGDAYDAQAVELDAANRRIDELTAKYQAEQQRTTELAQQIEANAESHARLPRTGPPLPSSVPSRSNVAQPTCGPNLTWPTTMLSRPARNWPTSVRLSKSNARPPPRRLSAPPNASPPRRPSATRPARKLPRPARKPPTGVVRSRR